jgi:phosphoenolpyruvate synthase/pyruvate phosphate dikinase
LCLEEFIDSVAAEFKEDTFWAVRSSAIDEDGSDFSFAGQFESYLFVNRENLAESIKKVWKSAFSNRVAEYRKNNSLKPSSGIAVIIQEMVDAEASRCCFWNKSYQWRPTS